MSEKETVWHYAVWRGKWSLQFMLPACDVLTNPSEEVFESLHGITINRGDVSCGICLRMMGPS